MHKTQVAGKGKSSGMELFLIQEAIPLPAGEERS